MMKLTGFVAMTTAMTLTLALATSAGAEDQTAQQSKGQIRLAKMLAGRVAGEPQSCIPMNSSTDLTVIDKTALVYKSGRTLYVNITHSPASIDDNDTLVRRTSNPSRLCSTDIITAVGSSGFYSGNVSLGEFVPYRKAD
ncbi:MAG: hypothetical protein WAT93_10635 [Pontixanthobacter sp.]